MFYQKRVFLEISQNSQENACARASFLIKLLAYNFIQKETLAQVFSCEFYEILKNTFFIEHLWWLLLYYLSKNDRSVNAWDTHPVEMDFLKIE